MVVLARPCLADSDTLQRLINTAQAALTTAAQAGLEAARWQYFSTPSATVQRSSITTGDPLSAGNRLITTAGISQPLWTWGRLQADVDKAQWIMAQAAREETRQQIALRVIQTYGEWLSAHQKRQAYSASLDVQHRLPEWVAADEDAYVATAQSMAADRTALLQLKRGLRARLQALAGWDVVAHTRAMEAAFEEMLAS